MTVYTIALLACLIADPTSCRTRTMAIEAPVVPNFVDVQVWCAGWQNDHPGWRVKRCQLVSGRGV